MEDPSAKDVNKIEALRFFFVIYRELFLTGMKLWNLEFPNSNRKIGYGFIESQY